MIVEERRQRDKEMAEEWAIREAESRKHLNCLQNWWKVQP